MFKKITAIAVAVLMMVSMLAMASFSASAEDDEVFANYYYHTAMWGDFNTWQIWGLSIFGQGAVNNGVLAQPTQTDPADERNGGNYMVTDCMVYTFAEVTSVQSMTFVSNVAGQFPVDYQIQYRDASYYSEAHGFTGNPNAVNIAGGENWPIIEGFGPDGGMAFTESSREGATVTIDLDIPVDCVAILVQATTAGSTPWSTKEAHFYGSVSEQPSKEPSEEPSEDPSEEPTEISKGDVNGDGNVNAMDASRVLLNVVGKITLDDAAQKAADVNGDGQINAMYACRILLSIVGKVTL